MSFKVIRFSPRTRFQLHSPLVSCFLQCLFFFANSYVWKCLLEHMLAAFSLSLISFPFLLKIHLVLEVFGAFLRTQYFLSSPHLPLVKPSKKEAHHVKQEVESEAFRGERVFLPLCKPPAPQLCSWCQPKKKEAKGRKGPSVCTYHQCKGLHDWALSVLCPVRPLICVALVVCTSWQWPCQVPGRGLYEPPLLEIPEIKPVTICIQSYHCATCSCSPSGWPLLETASRTLGWLLVCIWLPFLFHHFLLHDSLIHPKPISRLQYCFI